MKVLVLIPARYASTRFPGKPLAKIAGKEMILRVCGQVAATGYDLAVATDDSRIYDTVTAAGYRAVMTRSDHPSGTDRLAEAYAKIGGNYDVVVNVQGDEPFIDTSQLQAVMQCFEDDSTEIATLVKPFGPKASFEELSNPNSPKVVVDQQDHALYFSRSVIPYLRGIPETEWAARHTYLKHIGLYAYRAPVLQRIARLPQGELEQCESLEQLRWLQAGLNIKVGYTEVETIGIDTPADLQRAEAFCASRTV